MASSIDSSNGRRRFVIKMSGFTEAERNLLTSTFRLAGNRPFIYAEASAAGERPDIYLINPDSPEGAQQLKASAPNVHAPAVLIARQPIEGPWPLLTKPIQWRRLFDHMDAQMHSAIEQRARRQSEAPWDGRARRRVADKQLVIEEPPIVQPALGESVLVVDDSATVRAFMRAKLTPFRFDIDFAENGERALEMAQAKRYTCVFLDVLMPGMDGYQVCKQIKSSPASKGTAVVMLTSKSSAFDKFRGNWAGCDAYLGKPVGEDELLATIGRFLPSSRRVVQAILTRV